MRRSLLSPLAVVAAAVSACSSSYHPEYHPITVSNFSQNIAYPASVNSGPAGRVPVLIVPEQAEGGVLAAPARTPFPEAPPPDFFR